jgi:membrane protein YdbS with pleckstrin-like domain
MRDALRARLLRLLRVPAEPAPPPGDPALMRTFRAAPSFFRYKVAVWVLKQLSALAGLVVGYLFLRGVTDVGPFAYLGVIEAFLLGFFVLQLPFSFALVRLDFELRWYILSDRSLRIREGILSVREQTMTFANIQNIAIRQNPLERMFGIATVVARAAGGGGASSGSGGAAKHSHEATFEGVDNGDAIRDAIRARIRLHRDAGLGDPDEHSGITDDAGTASGAEAVVGENSPTHAARAGPDASYVVAAAGAGATDAARRVLAEARALRATLGGATTG